MHHNVQLIRIYLIAAFMNCFGNVGKALENV
jgi:hypothetical protein